MTHYLKKGFFVFCSINLVGLGVALFLESGLGSDSIGLLCDGIAHSSRISFGNASLVYNLIIILAALAIARTNTGIGTIAYALLSGYFIDFYRLLLVGLDLQSYPLIYKFLFFAVGQICMCLAFALLIQLKMGMNALDALLYKAEQHSGISYAILKTATDIFYVVIGTLLGGTFGAGTICSILLTGTMVSKFVAVGKNLKSKQSMSQLSFVQEKGE